MIVIDSLTLGGAERLLEDLSCAAPSAGLSVEVISLTSPTADRGVLRSGLEQLGIAPRFVGLRRLVDPPGIGQLIHLARTSACDVVHAHLGAAITLAPLVARAAGCPAVCTFHHIPGELSRRELAKETLAVAAANRCRRVVFVSHASKQGFAARYGSRSSWTVVPNGVNLERFSPGRVAAPVDLGIDRGVAVVSLIAAMRPGKGHGTAIKAWPMVTAAFPRAQLVLVGAGPLEPTVRAEAARNGVAASVVFAGLRQDVARILRASDVVWLPSEQEALPTALIEAGACARPVVASRVGGTSEVVRDRETGVLIAPNDPLALATETVALLANKKKREAFGRAARVVMETRFDARSWASRLRDVYEDASAVSGPNER